MTAPVLPAETPTVQLLRRRSSYSEHPRSVEPIETDLSWVFLTDRFAYKLKKPVRSDFLDLSTIEKRYEACQDELRWSRRLAAEVFLEVLPVTRSPRGRLQLNGHGTPVDWVLKMRRLPPERTLVSLLQAGPRRGQEIEQLAESLARFYGCQAPLTLRPDVFRQRLTQQVQSHLSDLVAYLPRELTTIHQVQAELTRQLTLQASHFDRRVCDGRVIEGLGDLHPNRLYAFSPPVVIGSLASRTPSSEVDIVDELSGLAMECERLGEADVGQLFLDHYSAHTADHPPGCLVEFYKAYRACRQACLQAIRARQARPGQRTPRVESAGSYLEHAALCLDRLAAAPSDSVRASQHAACFRAQ